MAVPWHQLRTDLHCVRCEANTGQKQQSACLCIMQSRISPLARVLVTPVQLNCIFQNRNQALVSV